MFKKFTQPALVFDGPLPPREIENVDTIVVMNGSVLSSQTGDELREMVKTTVFKHIDVKDIQFVQKWIQKYFDVETGTLPKPTPEVVEDVDWWTYEELDMVYKDSRRILVASATR